MIQNPISSLYNGLKRYFANTESYSTFRYILELTFVCFIGKILFIILAFILFSLLRINSQTDNSYEKDIIQNGWIMAFIIVILFAAFETLTGQWIVLWVASKFTKKRTYQILASAIVFALMHIEPILIAAVFPIGIVLAWTFILKSKRSIWHAFWVTTVIHVLHNLLVLGMVAMAV